MNDWNYAGVRSGVFSGSSARIKRKFRKCEEAGKEDRVNEEFFEMLGRMPAAEPAPCDVIAPELELQKR
jgi:hypothetical protein